MKQQPFSLKARLKSFGYAWKGITTFIIHEHNALLHFIATITVLTVAGIVGVSRNEWLALIFAIGFVWVAEMFNTCIERIMDFISVTPHNDIKFIKDLAAAAVLVAAITALIVGGIVFIPKI